jgi:hypothetical protein
MSYNPRIGGLRGANMVAAHPASVTSPDGTKRVSARNVKRSLAGHRWDAVRVYTLKVRAAGKWVVMDRVGEEDAEKFLPGCVKATIA